MLTLNQEMQTFAQPKNFLKPVIPDFYLRYKKAFSKIGRMITMI